MPLLESILEEFDRELDRLQALRKIVVGLSQTPALVRRVTQAAPIAPLAVVVPTKIAETTKPKRKARSDAGVRRGPRSPKSPGEAPALARNVPSGPVVFYPQEPAEIQNAKAAPADPEQDGTAAPVDLDAASRRLAALWTASLAS